MLTPDRVLELIAEERLARSGPVLVFWHRHEGGRKEFCDDITSARGCIPLFPLPLRGEGFTDPNGVAEDVVQLVVKHRGLFDIYDWSQADRGAVIILIISRTRLTLPQSASPAAFPNWFPRLGGLEIPIEVIDLESSVLVRLDAPEASVAGIRAAIYTLEDAILSRLERTQEWKRATDALAPLLVKDGEKFRDALTTARDYLTSISDPRGYRPSLGKPVSLTGRLLRLVAISTPDQLTSKARALMNALALEDSQLLQVPESMPALLCRPASPLDPRDRQLRFGCNLLQTLFAAHHFSTAVAHAADYPTYPLSVIQATSATIRETLASLERAIVLSSTIDDDSLGPGPE